MQLLCIDVGSGTQDILLLDTKKTAENSIQLVLPGGGACTGALRRHLQAGFKAYATPEAAQSFNDDLATVASWGVRLISHDEAMGLNTGTVISLRDIDLGALERSLSCWDIRLNPDAIGVAVLDHGAAPPGESQRVFRFQQLAGLLQKNNSLESFIFTSTKVPDTFTRMLAVVRSLNKAIPAVLMDTGAAAVLGASLDQVVAGHSHRLVINVGNSHIPRRFLSRILRFYWRNSSAEA